MSNVYSISPHRKAIEEASHWVVKLDKGLSEDENELLKEWIAQSEQNRLTLMKAGQAWDRAGVLTKLTDLFPQPSKRRKVNSWALPAIAASMAVIAFSFSLGIFSLNPNITTPTPETAELEPNMEGLYKTAIGEHINVTLPDGTQLNLNTNTTVRVNYSDHQRLLTLEQGELHVDVAHNEDRPLSVLAANQVIQAIGTAFNVELGSNRQVDLVVTEGKVLVEKREVVAPAPIDSSQYPIVMPQTSLAVSEGERIMLGQLDESIQSIAPTEIEVELSWQQGNLIFSGEPLVDAIEEISRYTSVEFVFLNEDLKQRKVAGLFEAGDIDGLLLALSDSFDIHYEKVDQKVLLSNTK